MASPEITDPVHGFGMHLAACVARHARTAGDRPALSFAGRTLTFAELEERSARLAGVLAAQGVETGDRVAILMTNRPEYVEAIVALSRLGAIAVPLNFRLTASEVAFQLADSGSVAVLTDHGLAATAAEASGGTDVRMRLVAGEAYEEAIASSVPAPERPVDLTSTALILYTSGTTGRPKGAMLTHLGLFTWSTMRSLHLGYPSTARTSLCAVPIFHVAGMCTTYTSLLIGGRLVVMPSGAFDPADIIDVLDRERINLTFFVPAQWQAIVRHPAIEGRTFPDLVAANWGAAPASASLVREIRSAFPRIALTSAFGMTETYATALILMPEDVETRPDSVGRPMLGVEVRVVDPEMNDVVPGQVGEIVYRGPTVMRGYWNAPDLTAEAFRGGWFHSGDLVRVDEDGFFYVVDRLKDMIISGGENIYCAEVENVLSGHPKVGSVAIVGCPDERWGEIPVAVVEARAGERPTLEELRAYARDRLAPYKLPRRLVLVDAMPMNAGGKVVKSRLRTLVGAASAAATQEPSR